MPLQIIRQDITTMAVDAIVNTTNAEMIGYSGVDLAVHTAAGPELDTECQAIAPLGLGMAKITKGYRLKAKHIIHTSGPVWRGGLAGESILLRSCYLECLKLAAEQGLESVAFPLISSGAYGYPKDQVLRFAVQVITEFLFDHEMTVFLCVYDRSSYEYSQSLFADLSEWIAAAEDGFYEDHLVTAPLSFDACESCAPTQKRIFSSPRKKIQGAEAGKSLAEYLKKLDKPFAYKLFELIDKRGITDVACYKKANVDKKTFSKIKCNPDTYKPSKQTAVAFAIALELDLEETQRLLATAGLTLSDSFVFDRIIRYFIQKKIYDIFEINQALFEFDQTLLGV